ncbi:MAG: hypothetical protein IIU28_02240 [Lachnospiraceae bacterium]|nr:hypothetical protein [Lachnospiraceae bacterium]
MEVIVGLIALVIVTLFVFFGKSRVEHSFSRLDNWSEDDETEVEESEEENE